MKCIIPGLNVKILGRAIHSMSRIGDELYVETAPHGLVLKTINSSESAFCLLTFSRSFFSSYSHSTNTICKISMKSALGVFKSPAHMDKQVEQCELKLDSMASKLVFTLRCKYGIVKTHYLSILDCKQLLVNYSKDMLPNRLSTQHKVLSEAANNFQPSEDKVTIEVDSQTFYLRNYTDNLDTSKIIRTQLSLKPVEFDQYVVGIDTTITFSMKEFRAVLMFAEAVNLPITLHFETAGKSAIFTLENNTTFEVDFVISTECGDSVTQQTASTTQVKRSSSTVKRSSDSWRESSVTKKAHIQTESVLPEHGILNGKGLVHNRKELPQVNDSQLFNFVETADETGQIPASPPSTQIRRVRTIFQRCFEATLDPNSSVGRHAVLALDSDCED